MTITSLKVRDLILGVIAFLVLAGTTANMLLLWKTWHQYQEHSEPYVFYELIGSLALAVLSSIVVVCAIFIVVKNLVEPVRNLTEAMVLLSDQQLDISIPYQTHRNEFGDMAQTLAMFRDKLRENSRLLDQQLEEDRQKLKKAKVVEEAIIQFDNRAKAFMDDMSGSMDDLEKMSRSLADASGEGVDHADRLQTAAKEASDNTEIVSQSAEGIIASISEVGQRVQKSKATSITATNKIHEASVSINALQDAAEEIGGVVTLINKIAQETNMLALNATIEAARAGEAGKGFAVVAGEVKKLASQTAEATQEISDQVESVKGSVFDTVRVIEDVGEVIEQMEEILGSVSESMEAQSRVSSEISSSAHRAVSVSARVFQTSEEIYKSAQQNSETAGNLGVLSDDLLTKTRDLGKEMQVFFTSIKL